MKKLLYKSLASVSLVALLSCTEQKSLTYCENGWGHTTVRAQVLDYYTHQAIDSIQFTVRYGMSGDMLIDTLMKQKDSVSVGFYVGQNGCEGFSFDLSNKHYYSKMFFKDSAQQHIKEGRLNEVAVYLKPATVFRLSLERENNDHTPDTAFLHVKSDSTDWEQWESFSASDFVKDTVYFFDLLYRREYLPEKTRLITFMNFESNTNYEYRWITKTSQYLDTLSGKFKAVPFDTVQLNYVFNSR